MTRAVMWACTLAAVVLVLTDHPSLAQLAIAGALLAAVLPTLPARLDDAARDRPPLFPPPTEKSD